MPMPRNNPGDTVLAAEWNQLADQIDVNTDDIVAIKPKLNAKLFPYLKTAAGVVSSTIQGAWNTDLINIGDAIQTASYHEGSDLGGCVYRVVAAATGTDDGGSFIDFTGFQLKAVFGDRILLSQFGAKAEFAADATAALNAALTAYDNIPVVKPVFIDGRYSINTKITFAGLAWVHLIGYGAADLRTSVLRFTGSTGIGFDFQQLSRFNLDGIGFEYSHASYDGILCDFSGVTSDTSAIKIERCWFGSSDITSATALGLVRVDSCHSIRFTDCEFRGAQWLILGQENDSIVGFPYSNAIQFEGCRFHLYVNAIARNGGEAWSFDSCTMEPSTTGEGRLLIVESGFKCAGFSVINSWLGDQTTPDTTVAWVEYRGHGFYASGNRIGVNESSFFQAMEKVEGVTIVGNHAAGSNASSIADFNQSSASGSLTSTGVHIVGNGLIEAIIVGIPQRPKVFRNNTPPPGAVWQDGVTGENRIGLQKITLGATATGAGVADWDTAIVPGFDERLRLGSSTNGPGGGGYYHVLVLEYATKDGTGNITQLAIPYSDITSVQTGMWLRGRFSGSWGVWVQLGMSGPKPTGYTTPSNLTTDRTFNANSTTIDEIADVLGTLIEDLKVRGVIGA